MEGIISGTVQGIVTPLMESLVIPKIKTFIKKAKLDINIYLTPTENHFREYFERTYKRLSFINTLALKNSQRQLKDIYLPLSLVLSENIYNNRKKENTTVIEGYPKELITEYNKILITDTAGMGKSTLMKRIFLDIVDNLHTIPIFIELRRLSENKTILQEIQEQLDSINKTFDSKLLLELLAIGGFTIILDGYDEISQNERKYITTNIQEFIAKTSNNHFIITSRPEKGLTSFDDFKEFNINPLTKDEAFLLIRKYDRSEEKEISKLLIKKLSDKNLKSILEFLKTPLLVSLLFTAFEYKQTIPLKKHLFYRQIYDAYFESHDLSKGGAFNRKKNSNLGTDDFECVLRYLSYLQINEPIEYTKDELIKAINDTKEHIPDIIFNTSDFIEDLTTSVPLFTKDGIYYKWMHKSIKEYFITQFIYKDAEDVKNDILLRIYNNLEFEKYVNILDLYYDVDYKSFKNTILYNLLKEYYTHSQQYTTDKFPEIEEAKLIERAELTFSSFFFLVKDNEEGNYDLHSLAAQLFTNREIERPRSGVISSTKSNNELLNQKNIETVSIPKYKRFVLLDILSEKNNKLSYFSCYKTRGEKKYEFKEICKLYQITDKPNNEFNLKVNFPITNLLLKSISRRSIIFHKEALTMLDDINKDISKKKNRNPFLDAISG